jgi:hypothetical protein
MYDFYGAVAFRRHHDAGIYIHGPLLNVVHTYYPLKLNTTATLEVYDTVYTENKLNQPIINRCCQEKRRGLPKFADCIKFIIFEVYCIRPCINNY